MIFLSWVCYVESCEDARSRFLSDIRNWNRFISHCKYYCLQNGPAQETFSKWTLTIFFDMLGSSQGIKSTSRCCCIQSTSSLGCQPWVWCSHWGFRNTGKPISIFFAKIDPNLFFILFKFIMVKYRTLIVCWRRCGLSRKSNLYTQIPMHNNHFCFQYIPAPSAWSCVNYQMAGPDQN